MPTVENKIEALSHELEELAGRAHSAAELMKLVAEVLHERLPKYNWAGFCMLEKGSAGQADTLVLGPFAGAPTPHTRISLSQGICGAAASSGQTIVVDDVRADARYLACSIETKSEIVIPIYVHGKVAGELDIDSHSPAAFGPEDRRLLEKAAAQVGRFLEKTGA